MFEVVDALGRVMLFVVKGAGWRCVGTGWWDEGEVIRPYVAQVRFLALEYMP